MADIRRYAWHDDQEIQLMDCELEESSQDIYMSPLFLAIYPNLLPFMSTIKIEAM